MIDVSYHWFSKGIHWITALLICGLLFVGFYMVDMAYSEDKLALYALHKSFGLLVLLMVFVRVMSYIFIKKPKPLSPHHKTEKALAHSAHAFLYFALFAMPLSGWVMSSAGDFSIQFFGVNLPDLVAKDEVLFKQAGKFHEVLAFALIAVVGLHAMGALKHHFMDQDSTLARMTLSSLGVRGGLVLSVCILILSTPVLYLSILKIKGMVYSQNEELVVQAEAKTKVENNADLYRVGENSAQMTQKSEMWNVQVSDSSIAFSATQYGQSFSGYFGAYDAEIIFDPVALEDAYVRVLIDIRSIKTGSEDRDLQAVARDWFFVDSFPYAEFKAEKFTKISDNQYVAHGLLSVRGVEKSFDLPFTLDIYENEARMSASVTLNRLDFGVGQGQWESGSVIGETVDISIRLNAYK